MKPRRYSAWVRLLCAVALGLGLSGAASAAATTSQPARASLAEIRGAAHDVAATSTRAPVALRHVINRRILPASGTACLVAAVLIGVLALAAGNHRGSIHGGGRRSTPAGARAPPVAIGI